MRWTALLAAAFAAACASNPAPQSAPRIEVVELRTSGDAFPQRDGRSIQGVDINSTLQLSFNLPNSAIESGKQLDPKLARDYLRLTTLLETMSRILELNVSIEQAYRATHDESGRLVRSQDDASLVDRYQVERAQLTLQAVRTTRGYVADQLGRTIVGDTLRDTAIARTLDSLGIRVSDFNGAYAAYLHNELRRADAAMRREASTIARGARPVTVRVRAQLIRQDGGTAPIHLPGYDTLAAGVPLYVDKLSFDLSEQEEEQLRRSFELHSNLATAITELRRNGFAVDSILQSFTTNLNAVFAALPADTIEAVFTRQIDTLRAQLAANGGALQRFAPALNAPINRIISRLDSARTMLLGAAVPLAELRQLARSDVKGSTSLVIDLPLTLVNTGITAAAELHELLFPRDNLSIVGLITSVDDSLRIALQQVQPIARNDSLLLNAFHRTLEDFSVRVRPLIDQRYVQLGKVLVEAKALTSPNLVRLAITTPNTSAALDVPAATAGPTELQLLRTTRREGDLLAVSLELRDNSGRVEEQNRLFRVLRYGAHSAVGANLVFAFPNRDGDNDPVLAPAVTYGVRYRMRESTGASRALNLLMPGLGLNLAHMDFSDEQFELGAGVGLSLFSGVVEGGFGYNFGSNVRYSYVALGVLDAVRQIRGR